MTVSEQISCSSCFWRNASDGSVDLVKLDTDKQVVLLCVNERVHLVDMGVAEKEDGTYEISPAEKVCLKVETCQEEMCSQENISLNGNLREKEQILTSVKRKKKITLIQCEQNEQVLSYDTLSLFISSNDSAETSSVKKYDLGSKIEPNAVYNMLIKKQTCKDFMRLKKKINSYDEIERVKGRIDSLTANPPEKFHLVGEVKFNSVFVAFTDVKQSRSVPLGYTDPMPCQACNTSYLLCVCCSYEGELLIHLVSNTPFEVVETLRIQIQSDEPYNKDPGHNDTDAWHIKELLVDELNEVSIFCIWNSAGFQFGFVSLSLHGPTLRYTEAKELFEVCFQPDNDTWNSDGLENSKKMGSCKVRDIFVTEGSFHGSTRFSNVDSSFLTNHTLNQGSSENKTELANSLEGLVRSKRSIKAESTNFCVIVLWSNGIYTMVSVSLWEPEFSNYPDEKDLLRNLVLIYKFDLLSCWRNTSSVLNEYFSENDFWLVKLNALVFMESLWQEKTRKLLFTFRYLFSDPIFILNDNTLDGLRTQKYMEMNLDSKPFGLYVLALKNSYLLMIITDVKIYYHVLVNYDQVNSEIFLAHSKALESSIIPDCETLRCLGVERDELLKVIDFISAKTFDVNMLDMNERTSIQKNWRFLVLNGFLEVNKQMLDILIQLELHALALICFEHINLKEEIAVYLVCQNPSMFLRDFLVNYRFCRDRMIIAIRIEMSDECLNAILSILSDWSSILILLPSFITNHTVPELPDIRKIGDFLGILIDAKFDTLTDVTSTSINLKPLQDLGRVLQEHLKSLKQYHKLEGQLYSLLHLDHFCAELRETKPKLSEKIRINL